jgi:uncharacterized small protein (DUF1192 family)
MVSNLNAEKVGNLRNSDITTSIANVTDLNAISGNINTLFTANINASSSPSSTYFSGFRTASDGNTSYQNILGIDYYGTIYSRTQISGIWGDWRKVWDSGNFTPNSLATQSTSSLTNNYLPKMGTGVLVNSLISDNGSAVTVGGSVTATGVYDVSLRSKKDIYTDATNGWKGDALAIINSTPIHEGRYKGQKDLMLFPVFDDDKVDTYDPHLINADHTALNTYSMESLSWLAIQNMSKRIVELEKEIKELKNKK